MNTRYLFILFSAVCLLSSCGPINKFTRLKRTPREYSLNYCCSDIKSRYTDYNKETWVVFSDRDNNSTYQNPGEKVRLKQMDFLEPFFVIKEKGDYVCLVKYDPDIVDDPVFSRRIKDRKKAQYYGWVHSSRLLLTRQSVTEISSGMKTKAISIVNDSTVIAKPHYFFESDSIWTYKDDRLTIKNEKIPFYELVYVLKKSLDKEKVLIARKAIIDPEEASYEILGWVSSSLVKDTGERLFVDMESMNEGFNNQLFFKGIAPDDSIRIDTETFKRIDDFTNDYPALRYRPVYSYTETPDGWIDFHTAVAPPVVDHRDNYVLNVDGDKIMYTDFLRLKEDLKKINVLFVFEGKEWVMKTFPETMNVIQNLESLFKEEEEDGYSYNFGAVLAYRDKAGPMGKIMTSSVRPTDNYASIMDFLQEKNDNISEYSPLSPTESWYGVRKAVEILEARPKETNLIVLVGEEGYSEYADSLLVKRMADANCRILGYQVHSEISNQGNNFVLQLENMISHCAGYESIAKRKRLVYTDQIRSYNKFRESSRNVYALDYPDNSMTQGWLLFPDKETEKPLLDIFSTAIDTFLMEVKTDNKWVTESLQKAFDDVGYYRSNYDSLWVRYHGKDTLSGFNRELLERLPQCMPAWHMSSWPVTCPDGNDDDLSYYLLLSESELNEITHFMDAICRYEPDYAYKGKKKKSRKVCNCPDDDLYQLKQSESGIRHDKQGYPIYMNTRKIRYSLYYSYMERLNSINRLCRVSPKKLQSYTLAQAQTKIVGSPVAGGDLYMFSVRDIKRKKAMPDHKLDELILYFKAKREILNDHIRVMDVDKFESNGETYYWISRDLLP